MRFEDLIPQIRRAQYDFGITHAHGVEATHLLLGHEEYRSFRNLCYDQIAISCCNPAMLETFCGLTVLSVNTKNFLAVTRPILS